jgi:putative oxidoreductase
MVGGLLLFHGIDKILHGIGYIEGMMTVQGLPKYLAFGVYVGEVLAPLLLLLGWRSRWWAAIIAFNMAAAIYLVHSKSFLELGAHGSWSLESPMFFFLGALAIVFLGSGKYAIARD